MSSKKKRDQQCAKKHKDQRNAGRTKRSQIEQGRQRPEAKHVQSK